MLEVIAGDKRQFKRISFDNPVQLLDGKQTYETFLIDISLNGALVKKPDNWSNANSNQLEIIVPMQHEYSNIRMLVHTAHEREDAIGFQCDTIDLDSISSLRRLVELNLGDLQLIERELSALVN